MFDPIDVIRELIRQPSVSTDSRFAEGMAGARAVLCRLFESMGLEVEVVAAPRHPVVLARRGGPADWPHVVIYGHYDVQPPDPLELWESPAFEPTRRGSRLYGRGAADNKGPVMVHIAAVAQLLRENPDLPLRVTFLIEGEEEIGSPSLPAILRERADELRGDLVLLSDTLNPSDDQVAITTGIRGMVTCEVELSGPRGDLHSGMYGGAVLNPIKALADLCAGLHGPDGRVTVPGFYDAVVEPEQWEKDEVAKLGMDDATFRAQTGVPAPLPPSGRTPAEAVRYEPTLEFNGIGGGYQGEGDKTIIPARAFVKISCRLVANQTPEDIRAKLFKALRDRCPPQVRMTIKEGHHGPTYSVVPPGRPNTPADQNPHLARAFAACHKAVEAVFGRPPLYLREGGSIPIIGVINQTLGMDCLMLGMGTGENNLHAPNESFDLDLLPKGIAVSKAILSEIARA
jgi:acetylornithine deacetylase/succinyl-diaminopimelate desuccinylase-like protein